jgi:hypothetical protein
MRLAERCVTLPVQQRNPTRSYRPIRARSATTSESRWLGLDDGFQCERRALDPSDQSWFADKLSALDGREGVA